MSFRAICIALLVSSLPIAGCGTVANLATPGPEQGGKSPFGGVRQDVASIKEAANGDSGLGIHPKPESEQHRQVLLMLLCTADLPFSFIGDVVTWPYTVAYTWVNQPNPTPPVTLAQPIPTRSTPQAPPTPFPFVPPISLISQAQPTPTPAIPQATAEKLPQPSPQLLPLESAK